MIAIELKAPHTHAGRDYAAGAVIDVDTATADWLVAHGVGRPAPASIPSIPARIARRRGTTGEDDHEH